MFPQVEAKRRRGSPGFLARGAVWCTPSRGKAPPCGGGVDGEKVGLCYGGRQQKRGSKGAGEPSSGLQRMPGGGRVGSVAVHEALKVLSQSVQVLASPKGFCDRRASPSLSHAPAGHGLDAKISQQLIKACHSAVSL
ncbi:hypothetical protein E2C01_057342 [Portunus trituberculatus]|uniref:Uncharacterized protein n=1 Tax=Portunus trituberculatus TaxID=210409 RepID=A0A5B7H083_PORTR|nr:hypothetical protein [Portunus trituberculatus]